MNETLYRELIAARDRDMRIARELKRIGFGVVSPAALVQCARRCHWEALRMRLRDKTP